MLHSDNLFRQFVAKRARTCSEVLLYLHKNHPELDADTVVEELEAIGMLNDNRFAANRIAYRTGISKWGDKKISYELQSLGIDSGIIRNSLDDTNEAVWLETAKKVIRPIIDKFKDREELERKVFSKLLTRGFSNNIIKKIIKDLI